MFTSSYSEVAVNCVELKIIGNQLIDSSDGIEPFFGTLFLWDAQRKVKVSEDFHFHLNSPEIMKMMGAKSFVSNLLLFLIARKIQWCRKCA